MIMAVKYFDDCNFKSFHHVYFLLHVKLFKNPKGILLVHNRMLNIKASAIYVVHIDTH